MSIPHSFALALGLALLAGCSATTPTGGRIDDSQYQRGAPIGEAEAQTLYEQLNQARLQRDSALESLRNPSVPRENRQRLQQAVVDQERNIALFERRLRLAGRPIPPR